MVRTGFSLGLTAVVLLGSAGWPASEAAGQTILKRLEEQIRQRVAQDRSAAADAAEERPKQEPGYLGAVVDDRQDRGRGVRVLDVRPEGPADQAGLREGDLITGAAGIRVRQTEDLADVMAVFPAGSSVAFDVLRDGQATKLDVVLGRRDAAADAALPVPETVPLPLPEPMADPGSAADTASPPADPILPAPEATEAGEDAPPLLPAEELEQLRARIAELERRVEQLEKALADGYFEQP